MRRESHVSWVSLNNLLHYESFWGEMPDISMIWFKLWGPLYFRNWDDKSGKVVMHPGVFMGFACNIGDPMTFKVLQCDEDPHNHNIVVYRGVVVLRSLTATGYNYALAPKSDSYFPNFQVECGPPNKIVPSEHQGAMDILDISIACRGGKRCKPSSSLSDGINHYGLD